MALNPLVDPFWPQPENVGMKRLMQRKDTSKYRQVFPFTPGTTSVHGSRRNLDR